MADKTFVGRGWAFKYGVNISVNLEELNKLTPNQYGDVKLVVKERKEPDAKSKATHYVAVDDFVPTSKRAPASDPF